MKKASFGAWLATFILCYAFWLLITLDVHPQKLIAGAVVIGSYVWKKNTLVSIVGGTVCYMVLVQFVF